MRLLLIARIVLNLRRLIWEAALKLLETMICLLLNALIFIFWLSFLLFRVFHVGHVDILRVLLIHKYVGIYELNTLVVNGDFNVEVRAKELKKLFTINVRVESIGSASKN